MAQRGPLDRLARALVHMGGALLVAANLVAFANVVSRKALSRPFSWSDELVAFLLVWVVYLCFLFLERTGGQLRVTVLYDVLPQPVQRGLDALTHLVVAAVLGYAGLVALGVARDNLRLNVHSPALGLPMGVLYGVVPLAFGLAALGRLAALAGCLLAGRRDGGERGEAAGAGGILDPGNGPDAGNADLRRTAL